jgi:hypothetical protein
MGTRSAIAARAILAVILAMTIGVSIAMPGHLSAATFSNTAVVSDTNNLGAHSGTSHSSIAVSGLSGTLTTVSVTVHGLTSTNGAGQIDTTLLLVSPGGVRMILLSNAGNSGTGGIVPNNATITLTDSAAGIAPSYPDPGYVNGGSYKPTDISHLASDDFSAVGGPAPPYNLPQTSGTATLNGTYGGIDPNGSWTLYVMEPYYPGTITLNTGWSLDIATAALATTTTVVSSNNNPSFSSAPNDSVTLTATVSSSSAVNAGSVQFSDGGVNIGSPVAVNSSGVATLTTTFATEGQHAVKASYSDSTSAFGPSNGTLTQNVDNHTTASGSGATMTFTDPGPLTVPATTSTQTKAFAYPSNLFVSGLSGTVLNITVALNGFSAQWPQDLHMLLAAPNGANLDFLSAVGPGVGTSGAPVTITLDDTAANALTQSAWASGTYKPTAFYNSTRDTFPSPGPGTPTNIASPGGTATLNNVFDGLNPNGTWKLYIVSTGAPDPVVTIGSWSVTITAASLAATTTAVSSSNNPSFTGAPNDSVTLTATVTSTSTVTTGTVQFKDGTANIGTPIAVSNGVATIATSFATEGDHAISAVYTDTATTFATSTGTLTQRVNNHTAVSGNVFTNPGPIAVPSGNPSPVQATPYPSDIFVSGISGAISRVTITLTNIKLRYPNDLDILLVGPTGASIDLLSNVGAGSDTSGAGVTITLDDAAASQLPQSGTLASGSFKPTAYSNPRDSFPAPGPGIPACSAMAAPGGAFCPGASATLASIFNGSDPNGTWQLFVVTDEIGDPAGSIASWSLAIQVPTTIVTLDRAAANPTDAASVSWTAAFNTAVAGVTSGDFALANTGLTGTPAITGVAPVGGSSPATQWTVTASTGTGSGTLGLNMTGDSGMDHTISNLTYTGGIYTIDRSPASIAPNGGTTPQHTTIGTPFGTALSVTVKDAFNNPVANATVTFTAPGSGASGTFANATATITGTTDASGVLAETFTANTTAGAYSVTASVSGVSPSATFSLTNDPGPANTLTPGVNTTPQTAPITTAFAVALSVTVTDSSGNTIADGTQVTFAAPPSGASATFPNGGVATTTNGIASIAATANGTAGGPYTVTAASNGHTATFQLTNTPGPAASIAPSAGTPQSVQVGNQFGTALAATVKDSGNNPVGNVSVTFAVNPVGGASGTFASSATVSTNSSGVATAPAFTANTVAGSYTVTANLATGPLTPAATFTLTNDPGPVASLTVGAGTTPQSAVITTAFATNLSVVAKDANSNVVPGAAITFTAPNSGASGTFATGGGNVQSGVTTGSGGVATASAFTANATAGGPYIVTADDGSGHTATFDLKNTPGAANSLTPGAGTTPQSAQITTTFGTVLSVIVKDAQNNAIPNLSIVFTAPASGASGSFQGGGNTATVQTNASGVATAPAFTANGTAGNYSVTANLAATPLGTPTTFALTNTPGAAASIAPSAGTPQHATVGTAFATALGAIVRDSGGNPVGAGVNVTFTVVPVNGAGGAFSGSATVVTNANGVATAPALTANTVAGAYTVAANLATGPLGTPATFALTNDPGPASHFSIVQTSGASAGVSATFIVTALDASSNVATGYTGTVHFTSSDPNAILPPDTTFTAADKGVKTVTATFNAPGPQTLTATDTGNGSITGVANGIAVGPATVTKVTVASSMSVKVGEGAQLAATATLSNSTTQDMTAAATWTSSDDKIATVDASGKVTGKGAGTATITATVNGVAGSATVAVVPPLLTGVVPNPAPSGRPGSAGITPPAGIASPAPNPAPAPRSGP